MRKEVSILLWVALMIVNTTFVMSSKPIILYFQVALLFAFSLYCTHHIDKLNKAKIKELIKLVQSGGLNDEM